MSVLSYLLPECPRLSTHFVLICPNLCTPLYSYVRILPRCTESGATRPNAYKNFHSCPPAVLVFLVLSTPFRAIGSARSQRELPNGTTGAGQ
jgi:hypothetical protein